MPCGIFDTTVMKTFLKKIDHFCYMHAEAIWACSMLCSIGNYNNLAYFPGIHDSYDVKHRSRKMKLSLNIYLCLKTALPLPRRQKVSTKMEKRYLHTVKSIAKIQYCWQVCVSCNFYHLGSHVCCFLPIEI